MDRSIFQERLTGLFLRLNGYFQTGFIAHSEVKGRNGTEFDRIAIRFPRHSQPEREIDNCLALKIPDNTIDIVIAEVKNADLEFNASIKSNGLQAIQNWEQLLRWCGLFNQDEIRKLVPQLITIVDKDGLRLNDNFEIVNHSNEFGNITLRPILFSIESVHGNNDPSVWINGDDMISYIWDCLCPLSRREDCSTRYPQNWGFEFGDIVMSFKNSHKSGKGKPSTFDLYNEFKV